MDMSALMMFDTDGDGNVTSEELKDDYSNGQDGGHEAAKFLATMPDLDGAPLGSGKAIAKMAQIREASFANGEYQGYSTVLGGGGRIRLVIHGLIASGHDPQTAFETAKAHGIEKYGMKNMNAWHSGKLEPGYLMIDGKQVKVTV